MMSKTKKARATLPTGAGKVLKRLHYPLEVILLCVRWQVAYSLGWRNLEESRQNRNLRSCSTGHLGHDCFGHRTQFALCLMPPHTDIWQAPTESHDGASGAPLAPGTASGSGLSVKR
jgi:hypothetical protein